MTVLCLVLMAVTFAVYAPTIWHEYIDYDDGHYVFDNPHVATGLSHMWVGPSLLFASAIGIR